LIDAQSNFNQTIEKKQLPNMSAVKQRVLLFREFPFDFEMGLPIALGRKVTLAQPYEIDGAIQSVPGREALFLQEQAGGLGQVHVSMQAEIGNRGLEEASNRLWLAMAALRLASPLKTRTSSILTFCHKTSSISDASSLSTDSVVDHNQKRRLNEADIAHARRINLRLRTINGKELIRLRSALTLWGQVSIGMCSSWQLSMIGLIASIEALFPQPRRNGYDGLTYGKRLSTRVGRFLGNRLTKSRIQRIINVYDKYRNPIAHGVHNPNPKGVPPRRYADLYFIHEIARLALLGMLSKPNLEIADLLPVSAGSDSSQRKIDACSPASGSLITDQVYVPQRRPRRLVEY
jgi:hypothetical protein